MASLQERLSKLPKVDRVLQHPRLSPFHDVFSREFSIFCIQEELAHLRKELLQSEKGKLANTDLLSVVLNRLVSRLQRMKQPSLGKVINATGVLLHTGLGRAPLSDSAQKQVSAAAQGYCNLEFDLKTGERGSRISHVDSLLRFLTGAEAVCVVNNNAAAVLLALNTLAFGRETIISRGQLVEIGGSFRIPDIMEKSGTRMVEVGTTNRTHLKDYAAAVTTDTGLICHVHTSNYRVQGFTKEVDLNTLVTLAVEKGVPFMQDLGGGVLFDLQQLDFPYEPVVKESINAGVDLVTFSGDKVLGGPQCGIIVGKSEYVKRLQQNPIMRALRCDKLTIAALEATLRRFIFNDGRDSIEVLKMLSQDKKALLKRAKGIRQTLRSFLDERFEISIVETCAQMGSGAMPLEEIPSIALRLISKSHSPVELARALREASPAIVGYIRDEALLLDLRTVGALDDAILIEVVGEVLPGLW